MTGPQRHHNSIETMLDLHRRLLEMQVEQADREIDALVYDLYALTPAECAVVEAAVVAKR